MVTLEQVEKLREYANISYDEAKTALENAGGDILQALIDLERAGKVKPPQGGGRYNSGSITESFNQHNEQYNGKDPAGEHAKYNGGSGSAFSRNMRKFIRWLGEVIHKGNINAFIIERNGSEIMKLPITVLVILLFFVFWFVVPLMIVGLFFNFRYYFRGPDIKSAKVNSVIDSVADAAEEIKNDIKK